MTLRRDRPPRSEAAVALVATPAVERRQPSPIIDLGLLRNSVFALANVSLMLSTLALFAVGFLLPFYFEDLRSFDPLTSGLLLTPFYSGRADRPRTPGGGLLTACLMRLAEGPRDGASRRLR
jgi:hypothetical protein